MVNNIEVKQLFNYNRFPDANIVLFLYVPFGLLLALGRILLLLLVLLFATVLPKIQFLQVLYQKLLCIVFGISINAENIEKKEDVDAFVSNQLSVLDSFVLHILTQCITAGSSVDTQLSKLLGFKYFGPLNNHEILKNNITMFKSRRSASLFLQPEKAITNGKGLLKFDPGQFALATKVQPVLLEIKRPLIYIAVNTIESTYWSDIFYFMFSPMTIFKIKFMPSLEKKVFSDEDFGNKVQLDMGKSLDITPTSYTVVDMKEYQKRYLAEQQRMHNAPPPPARVTQMAINAELQRMGRQVKEVLPMVPLNVIYRDLVKTKNVDMTISNILEGLVPYVPEQPTPSTSTSSSTTSAHSSPTHVSASPQPPPIIAANTKDPFNTAASSFGKSANERMLSFQERKAQLIANARQRYIEKHGLDVALNTC